MADIVSERYAQSLYEVAKDEKQEKEYLEELTAVCGAFRENPDFIGVFIVYTAKFQQTVLTDIKTMFYLYLALTHNRISDALPRAEHAPRIRSYRYRRRHRHRAEKTSDFHKWHPPSSAAR